MARCVVVPMTSSSAFDALAARFIEAQLSWHPVEATYLGVAGHDRDLPDLSAAGFERRVAERRDWQARIAALSTEVLSPDEQIDRELLLSALAREESHAGFEAWRRSPEAYVKVADGILALFLMPASDEAARMAAVLARLAQIPAILEQGVANLHPDSASRLLVARELRAARANAQFLGDLLPGIVEDSSFRWKLERAGGEASKAYTRFVQFLEHLLPRANGDFAFGEERYAQVLSRAELLATTPAELQMRASAVFDALESELGGGSPAARDAASAGPGGRAATECPQDPEEMLAAYTAATEKARRFIYERGIASPAEGEICLVEPAPLAWRETLSVACYVAPPLFGESRTGRFMVPWPTQGATPADTEDLLMGNSYSDIPTTAVHEAYPGHHWHLMTAAKARPLRKLLSSTYFVEGWALYAEKVMDMHGFFDSAGRDGYLRARRFRAVRVEVDTGLHCGGLAPDEAVRIMQEKAGLPHAVARAEVARYCAWPTQASAYLTGALAIGELAERWSSTGRSERDFHDSLAATGALPVPLAGRAVGL